MSDPLKYRTKEEQERAKERDPITLYETRLRQQGLLTEAQLDQMQDEVAAEINQATAQAEADPHPPLEDRFTDILAEKYPFPPR